MTNLVKDEVPQGNFFGYPGEDKPVEIAAILDQNGEIFFLDKLSRTVYWAHKTNVTSYFRYLATGVDNYIDFCPVRNLLYHHYSGNRKVISFSSQEDLQKRLKEAYPVGIITVECNTSHFELDYQTGSTSTDQTKERLTIRRHQYDITFSSPELATIRWELKFSKLELTFPKSKCPCMVYHAQSLVDFINLCTSFGITKLPGRRTVDDFKWMHLYQSNKINYDNQDLWIDNKSNGFYEGTPAMVMRFQRRDNTIHNIRELRLFKYYFGIIRFLGWQEDDDYFYLAFERTKWNFEEYVMHHMNTQLRLSLLRDLAFDVYELYTNGVIHGDLNPKNVFVRYNHKPKLGLPSFLTQGDRVYAPIRDIQSLGKLMLYYSSRGAYIFNNEEDVKTEQLNMCEMPELRHLIKWLTSKSPPTKKELLLHPWIMDTHTVIQLITTLSDWLEGNSRYVNQFDKALNVQKVFTRPWNEDLDEEFVKERVAARAKSSPSSKYDFGKGSSLLRIMRNAFNHHGEMDKEVKKKVGKTKEKMLDYFRGKFPNLVLTSYLAIKGFYYPEQDSSANLKIFYEGDMAIR